MAMIRSRHAEKPPKHEKHSGNILVLHPVIPVHIPPGLARMTSTKIQILPGTPSENVSCSWRDPDHTCSCDHFFRTCMHFFPESCRSRRFAKGPGRGGRKKAKEEAAAVKDPVSLTLSVVGDCTLGTDETFDYDTSLNACYDNNGKDYF